MKNIIILIIVGLVGVAVGIWLARRKNNGLGNLNEKRMEEKEEKKEKILELFKSESRITNNDVQELLSVSDASAENYLDELEKEGKIRQVGETGRFVEYEING